MAELGSGATIRRHLRRENMSDIPSENTIRCLYATFLEIGAVLTTKPMNSIRVVSQEVNMSKSVVHRTMRQMGSNTYKMHLIEQFSTRIKTYASEFFYSFLIIKRMMM